MVVREKLAKYTYNKISNIDALFFDTYARNNNDFFKRMYDKEIIDDKGIENSLKEPLKKILKRDFHLMFNKDYYADHILHPEILAYVLERDALPKDLVGRIPFDHGDTVESYIEQWGQGHIPSIWREKLLNPKPAPVYSDNYGSEDIDHCGTC